MNTIKGSIVALVTPMTATGALDLECLDRLIDFQLEQETDAIAVNGTTGEAATLDVHESLEVIGRTVKRVAGRIPVIAGTGTNSTTETIALTKYARDIGAEACLLLTPYYIKPTQEGLYRHFMAVAEAVDIPQILYNVPARTACDLLPVTVARLSAMPRIIGIKEASGSLLRMKELADSRSPDFFYYSGDDITACEACLLGATGVFSVTANVAPQLMHRMCSAAAAGERANAIAIHERLIPLHQALFGESNPIPVKWALREMGLIQPGIRLPLTWLSEKHHERLRRALQQAGN